MKSNIHEELAAWGDFLGYYVLKIIRIHLWNLIQWINRHTLKTYPLIEDCSRCEDCGRNVHDFHVPDNLWKEVIANKDSILCYDCFANRSDKKLGLKWRLNLIDTETYQDRD